MFKFRKPLVEKLHLRLMPVHLSGELFPVSEAVLMEVLTEPEFVAALHHIDLVPLGNLRSDSFLSFLMSNHNFKTFEAVLQQELLFLSLQLGKFRSPFPLLVRICCKRIHHEL